MKAKQTLYLLAADRDFRLLLGAKSGLSEIAHRKADDFPDVENPFGAEAGRGHSGSVSYSTTDRGGPEVEERRRFARHAIAALEAEWAGVKADGIVIAAGPKMLGELRDALPKALAAHVVADLDKDLVKIALHDLPSHFEGLPGV